jgi:hypothetical protein
VSLLLVRLVCCPGQPSRALAPANFDVVVKLFAERRLQVPYMLLCLLQKRPQRLGHICQT